MSDRPFVSFIIPARNDEKMIPKCLRAINEINYDKRLFEILVIDNSSSDRTAEIARSFGARVSTLPRATISLLRNSGAKDAKGDFLAFIDADCVVDKNWLTAALHHFQDPLVGCVGSYPNVPVDDSWVPKAWDVHQRRYAPLQEVDWLPSRAVLVRSKASLEIGGFNASLVTCEDVDFGYRLKKKGYKIISDGTIRSIHFGEPNTIFDFFKKERWRGYSNFRGLLSHGLCCQEIPSLILPVYYLIALACLPISASYALFQHAYLPFLVNSVFVILPPILLSARTSLATGDFAWLGRLAFLYLIYSFARTTSFFCRGHSDGKATNNSAGIVDNQ
jgi:glycosyltransferase involved in cell wall biosynthesis